MSKYIHLAQSKGRGWRLLCPMVHANRASHVTYSFISVNMIIICAREKKDIFIVLIALVIRCVILLLTHFFQCHCSFYCHCFIFMQQVIDSNSIVISTRRNVALTPLSYEFYMLLSKPSMWCLNTLSIVGVRPGAEISLIRMIIIQNLKNFIWQLCVTLARRDNNRPSGFSRLSRCNIQWGVGENNITTFLFVF